MFGVEMKGARKEDIVSKDKAGRTKDSAIQRKSRLMWTRRGDDNDCSIQLV